MIGVSMVSEGVVGGLEDVVVVWMSLWRSLLSVEDTLEEAVDYECKRGA